MRYTLQLSIHRPPSEVWRAFTDPEKMKTWQPTLIRIEQTDEPSGQSDEVTKLTYKENEREFSLFRKITQRVEGASLLEQYENKFAANTIRNTFVAQDINQTLWVQETDYRFKTLIMKILGPLLKKNFIARSRKDMERFKEMVESQ